MPLAGGRSDKREIDAPPPPAVWPGQRLAVGTARRLPLPALGPSRACDSTAGMRSIRRRHLVSVLGRRRQPVLALDRRERQRAQLHSGGKDATTGYAKIIGDDPLKLQVVDQGVYKSILRPTKAAIRAAAWCITASGTTARIACIRPAPLPHDGINYNWPWLGPFVGFRYSTDFGKTWTQTPCTPAKPLFGETALQGEPVKIGSPHFVDFGKNMEHSPDGKAYLVAHGAIDGSEPPLRLQQLDHRRRDLPAPRHAQHREHQRRRRSTSSSPAWTAGSRRLDQRFRARSSPSPPGRTTWAA